MQHPNLDGIMPPIPTPFINDEVAYDQLAGNVEKWSQTGIAGILALSSNGEYVYLTEKEKIEVVRTVAKAASPEMSILAGSGCESTSATIKLTAACAESGAHAALVATPCYYGEKMTSAALVAHFETVADASPIPIMLYNVPKFTHVNIAMEAIATLSEHPNIIGMKDSLGNVAQLGAILNAAKPGFKVMVGTAGAAFSALTLGCCGGILALSIVAPRQSVQIYKLVQEGQMEAARLLQLKMLPVNVAVTATYGIAGAKYGLDRLGYFGGMPRKPMLPLSADDQKEMDTILTRAELLP